MDGTQLFLPEGSDVFFEPYTRGVVAVTLTFLAEGVRVKVKDAQVEG